MYKNEFVAITEAASSLSYAAQTMAFMIDTHGAKGMDFDRLIEACALQYDNVVEQSDGHYMRINKLLAEHADILDSMATLNRVYKDNERERLIATRVKK